jgi:hypothetical protein
MSALTQVTVTYLVYSNANPAVVTTATAVLPVSAGLQALDSPTNAAVQTGFSALDSLLAAITKRKGITFTDATGVVNFIPLAQIVKIIGA